MPSSTRWDIVCRVVDNFGDAGVCFRLARELATAHGIDVTLWIDDVAVLARIVPSLATATPGATVERVRVCSLATWSTTTAREPDVVIEGFGCGLPDAYVAAMAARVTPPLWIVLEYLSAEPWIDMSHALPSPHPRLALTRWFWFPGFTAKTGGLLREADLLARRDTFHASTAARVAVRRALGLDATAGSFAISLFCYPNPALLALLDAWAEGDEPVACIVPEGIARAELDAWTGGAMPHPGGPFVRGRLMLVVAPFADQDGFDRRLWACDLNFVRGEDSFVRAQWAALPFVWQPYPQDADAHLAKMDAFLSRVEAFTTPAARTAQRAFWYAWNTADATALGEGWAAYRAALPELRDALERWSTHLALQPDLAQALVEFSRNKL